MRIVIPSVQVPFIRGGANLMTEGLANALREAGHEVEIVTFPFKFFPEAYIDGLIDIWMAQDFSNFNGYKIDRVIVLQFPAYFVRHQDKALWLMHQHRAVYDSYHAENASDELSRLRDKIHPLDTAELKKYKIIYTMSKNVSHRLKKYNDIPSIPLYHPPYGGDLFYCEEPYDYIFYPSRLESHKRQDLLIKAMKLTRTPVKAIIAGIGGQEQRYRKLIEDLELRPKVRLIGTISEEEKYAFYARALAVFFGPLDEDYGYVTLEAMLSQKSIITCTDSGGPLEFILDRGNGFIIEPNPELIAERMDWLYENQQKAKEMGKCGLESYKKKNINWENVVRRLVEQ
jgi:glycosyltransferase involved in cell wall biosynthesis